ncbi:691_t:CDS:2, partial [Entrophospora sp. SA101]
SKLNLKQAIDYIDQSWSGVTTKTVKNCCGKTGILPGGQNLQTNSVVNEDDEFTNPFKIVEMVLEDAQIEAGANVNSDEDNENHHHQWLQLKKLMDL